MKKRLTDEDIQLFHKDGFIIIDAFTEEEVEDFNSMLKQTVLAFLKKAALQDPSIDLDSFQGKEVDAGVNALSNIDKQYIADIYDTISCSPELNRLVSKKELSTYVNQLMGLDESSPLYLFTPRCRIDPPADERKTYGWHQEVFYSLPKSKFLQLWAPLIHDSHSDLGAMEALIGSHKEGIAKQSWNEVEGRALQILVDDDICAKYEKIVAAMKCGKAVIFSNCLVHKSGTNISDKVRYSLICQYNSVPHKDFDNCRVSMSFKGTTPRDYYEEVFPEVR